MDFNRIASRIAVPIDIFEGPDVDPAVRTQIVRDFDVFQAKIKFFALPQDKFLSEELFTGDTQSSIIKKFQTFWNRIEPSLQQSNPYPSPSVDFPSSMTLVREFDPSRVNVVSFTRGPGILKFDAGWVLHDLAHHFMFYQDINKQDVISKSVTPDLMRTHFSDDCGIDLDLMSRKLGLSNLDDVLMSFARREEFLNYLVRCLPLEFLKSGESHRFNLSSGIDLWPDLLPISTRNFQRIDSVVLKSIPYNISFDGGAFKNLRIENVSGTRSNVKAYGNRSEIRAVPHTTRALSRIVQEIMKAIVKHVDQSLSTLHGKVALAFVD